jgi:wyosine [tRNA(Phe)-imidazoG37] synthetase (radical SAM superfamily)
MNTIDMNNNFTSNGIKFWKNFPQMQNYKDGNPNTIISTHISPESRCNLSCSYCSVKKRDQYHIELNVIKDYVAKLMTRGLRSVIITGGGEPTLYPDFNELVQWLKYDKKLSVALITNGTNTDLVDDWNVFSWIRVSINIFKDWENRIELPIDKFNKDTIIGMSYIDGNQKLENIIDDLKMLKNKLHSSYIRILPNCLLPKDELEKEHQRIAEIFKKYNLTKFGFFHQYKNHEAQDRKSVV